MIVWNQYPFIYPKLNVRPMNPGVPRPAGFKKQGPSMSNTCPVVGYVLLRSENQPRLLVARLKNQPGLLVV